MDFVKPASSFVELDNILLMSWLFLLQMPCLGAVWTIVTLSLEACNVSVITRCRVFRMIWHVLSKIIKIILLSHPSQSDSIGCLQITLLKSTKLVYKFLHCCSPGYFGPSLSLSSCCYRTRCSHLHCQNLTVPPFHSLFYKSVTNFGHTFTFDTSKIWNDLPHNLCSATSFTSFTKKLKT